MLIDSILVLRLSCKCIWDYICRKQSRIWKNLLETYKHVLFRKDNYTVKVKVTEPYSSSYLSTFYLSNKLKKSGRKFDIGKNLFIASFQIHALPLVCITDSMNRILHTRLFFVFFFQIKPIICHRYRCIEFHYRLKKACLDCLHQ